MVLTERLLCHHTGRYLSVNHRSAVKKAFSPPVTPDVSVVLANDILFSRFSVTTAFDPAQR
jgi:hypothetical protein